MGRLDIDLILTITAGSDVRLMHSLQFCVVLFLLQCMTVAASDRAYIAWRRLTKQQFGGVS